VSIILQCSSSKFFWFDGSNLRHCTIIISYRGIPIPWVPTIIHYSRRRHRLVACDTEGDGGGGGERYGMRTNDSDDTILVWTWRERATSSWVVDGCTVTCKLAKECWTKSIHLMLPPSPSSLVPWFLLWLLDNALSPLSFFFFFWISLSPLQFTYFSFPSCSGLSPHRCQHVFSWPRQKEVLVTEI